MIEALRANEPKLKIGWALMRVSTKDQALVQHGSLEQQRHMLERWSTQQTEVTGQTYEITRFFEEDISGRGKSLHKRLALVEIERAIDAKAIDFLVFEKVDRLARDMIYNLGLVKKANANGIEVHEFESGKIDLRDRGSRLGFNIKNLLAEEYSLELEEKITKKQREARVNNGKDTSTMPVLGLDPHPGKRCMYVINQDEQKIVEKIFEYFLKSGSIIETANWANENGFRTKVRWKKETVDKNGNIIKPKQVGGDKFDSKKIRYLLSNQKLRGHARFKDSWNQFPKMQDSDGFVSWNYAHGPVISPELFQRIEDLLATHSLKDTRQREHFYFLSGILFHEDGSRYQGTPVTAKNIYYYYCPKHKQRIRKDMIENLIFNRIKEYLEKGDLLPRLIATAQTHQSAGLPFIQEEISEIQTKIKECNKVIEGFSTMLRKSVLLGGDSAETIIRTLTEEKETAQKEVLLLQRQLDTLEIKKKSYLDEKKGPALAQKIKAVLKTLDQKPDIEKRQILQSIVKKVVVYGKSKIEVILVGNSSEHGGNSFNGGQKGKVLNFGREGASYSAPLSMEQKRDLNFMRSQGEILNFESVTLEAASFSSGKMAGLRDAERTVSSPEKSKPHLIEMIEFIHTEPWRSKTFLEEKYVKNGRSIAQIAEEILSSRAAVRDALIEFGIPLKQQGKPGLRPAQVPYGYRRSDGLLVPHLGEQRVIQSVRKMSKDGLSYRQICDFLTSVGVPTKNQGKGWQPEMIRRVLNR